MSTINRVEYREDREPIQVTTKEKIEHSIMKENSLRFRFMHSSLMLEGNLRDDLGLLGKGDLSIGILHN